MDTHALALGRQRAAENLPERLTWGAVALSVTDPDRTERFWRDALGFVRRPAEGPNLALGTSDRTLVVLHPGAASPAVPRHAGLYHVAYGMPSQAEFSRRVMRLGELAIPHAAVDHVMSKAIYLSDPDGHGIEIAYKTPQRFGRFSTEGGRFALVDAEGRTRSGREKLDLCAEMRLSDRTDPAAPVHRDAVVAHLHLHVPELNSALAWFEGIGFVCNLTLTGFGMADMGTGAPYTHRLAVNLWAGRGVVPAPATSARLLSYDLETGDAAVFAAARKRLTEDLSTGDLVGTDPAGVLLRLRLRGSMTEQEAAA